MLGGTFTVELDPSVSRKEASLRLVAWHEVAAWLDHTAEEFVADATTRGYLEHVGQCIRDEGERKYAARAGVESIASR